MLDHVSSALPWIGGAIVVCSLAYLAFALVKVLLIDATLRRRALPDRWQRAVTILKPVCGIEPRLYENLRSYCDQDYPDYQVIFGLRYGDDPARAVIEQLIAEFPGKDLSLVVDDRIIGTNYKVSNLANMYREAKHDIIVIADSDTRVDRDSIARLVEPFADRAVGGVTCLYKGVPMPGYPSQLGAMFINEWFLPSVLVGLTFQELRFCFGATMAVRRDVLERIGGFAALADFLADDYMLGQLIAREGFRVELAPHMVANTVHEPSWRSLLLHELRWARTMRSAQPLGFASSFVTDAVPLALLADLCLDLGMLGDIFVALAVLLRVALHYAARAKLGLAEPATPWLLPLRDLLTAGIRAASFFGREVQWRNSRFNVRSDGQMIVNS